MNILPVAMNPSLQHEMQIAKRPNIVIPILLLYHRANHLARQGIFPLQGIYTFTSLLFDILTGYFAGILDRKTSSIAGLMLVKASYVIYCTLCNCTISILRFGLL